jgi:putative transposase
MIDRPHDLPVARQCQVLSLARSTAYYRPQEASEADLALMRRIDALHLEHPFAGSRMLRDMLKREGFSVGRQHVATLMKKWASKRCTRSPTPAAAIPRIPFIRICCAIWRSIVPIRYSPRTSRTSP